MTKRLTTALLLAAIAVPGASALAPAAAQPQLNPSPQGYFYSAGRSYLGINVEDVTKDRVTALKLKEERGVEITMVDQDAPAGKAGLKEHDVVLDFNGTRVESEEQFRRMVRETPAGRTVTLGISRDGNPMNVQVQLGDRGKIESSTLQKMNRDDWHVLVAPEPPEMPEMPDFNFDIVMPTYTPSLGAQVDTLGQQLGEYFGVKDGEGVLVKSVEKGSAAEKAGLKAGDVITKIQNEKISDRSDLRRILRSHREGGKINVTIVRDKREQNLTVDLPAARRSRNSSSAQWSWPDMDSIDDMRMTLDEMGPEVRKQIRTTMEQLRPQLQKARVTVEREITPEIKKNLRQMQSEMQKLRKDLLKQQQQWRKQLRHEFI